jgi:hypothetical protein
MALFTLERFIGFNKKDKLWFQFLTFDAAYLHAMVFTTQGYFDLLSGRKTNWTAGHGASLHFSKTLRLLRERLLSADEKAKVSTPTMLVILLLAFHAHVMGDYKATKYHIGGLRKIVSLRGGMAAFSGNTKLLIEMLR